MAKDLFFIPLGGSGGGGGFDPTMYYTKSQVDALIQDFITRSVNDLVNYYTKSETYTQAEVNTLIGGIESIHFEFAASTSDVQDPQSNVIYLIGPSGTGEDQYEEYVYVNNQWKKIGDTSIDLSGYATLTDLQNAINTAMATLQQYAVENFYQKSEVDAMIAQVQTLQGIQGIKGSDGINGAQGIQGIKGDDGVNGVDGSQGIQGIKGTDGTNGIQGIQGIRGDDGKNGVDGLQGIQGIQGASGGGVETVELTELTESELGELYEIVVNSTPVGIDDYLAEHRLVAYGMPVTSWGNGTFTIDTDEEKSALIADREGENGVVFYTDTNIIKEAETPDTISAHWYCIFAQEDGGNYTYVLDDGINTYENSGGGGGTRYDISTKSQSELAEFYQNWQTIMASNDVYFGVYPVVSVNPRYTQMDIGGVTVDVMLVEYNLQLGFVNDMPNIVSGKAGAWYILPNGMGGDYTAEMLFASKDYVDNGLQGKQNTLTAGEGISIQGTTISATGGGGSAWYGTQAEFDALQNKDTNTDYFISDPITWDEIADKPNVPTKISELPNDEGYVTDKEMKNYINEKKIMHIVNSHNWYGTQAEYEALQTLNPDTNYHIEGDEVSLQMTFTFTDSTQAVYDVFVRPTV